MPTISTTQDQELVTSVIPPVPPVVLEAPTVPLAHRDCTDSPTTHAPQDVLVEGTKTLDPCLVLFVTETAPPAVEERPTSASPAQAASSSN